MEEVKKIELIIMNKGIRCEGCENRIKKELEKKKGILVVEPNHLTQKIKLEFIEAKIKLKNIIKTIGKLGYFIEKIIEV